MSANTWQDEVLDQVRAVMQGADPDVVEEAKWAKPTNPGGVPTWSRHGIICTGETYKDKVKLTFMYGASLDDPSALFNAGLGGGTRRAIDIREGDEIDDVALTALVRRGIEFNAARVAAAAAKRTR